MNDFIMTYGVPALAVVGALVVLFAAIAPLTKTKLDDILLGVFTKLRDVLAFIISKGQSAGAIAAVAEKKHGVVEMLSEKFNQK